MSNTRIEIPDLMRHRAMLTGDAGERWLSGLDQMLTEIAEGWQLTIGAQLSGGTEALVFLVLRGGNSLVLKIGLPGSSGREAETLRVAQGRGYAELIDWDEGRDALLLERLGAKLADSSALPRQQMEMICRTLKLAWRQLNGPANLMTGAQKAKDQADFIQAQWSAYGYAHRDAIVDKALQYACERERAYAPGSSYLVHGDAHIWNTLQVPNEPEHYKFVDPDGLFAEPALDLAISLREWRDELLEGDTVASGLDRCRWLSQLTGVGEEPIWQWAFIEHVSCGLLDAQLGDSKAAAQHFTIAERWLEA